MLFKLQMTERGEYSILLFTEVGFELRVVCTQNTYYFHKILAITVGMDELEHVKNK